MSQENLADIVKASLLEVGSTHDAPEGKSEERWRDVFSGLWGSLDLRSLSDELLSGSLHSRTVGGLTFSRIEFGNQMFERTEADLKRVDEPFYSLTFPDGGQAVCEIGDKVVRLSPQRTYLLNNDMAAKLWIEKDYATFNVKIPTRALEHRLGRRADILEKAIVHPDAIYHMMRRMIVELLANVDLLDEQAARFMSNQMLDTVAFFLTSGGQASNDSLALQSTRASVLAYLDAHYGDAGLTPRKIAAACGISRSYLYKVFSDGEPVMERLRRRRLEAARGMIVANTGRLSMTQIAMACGFTSSSEFSRLFKNAFGTAPSRYG